MDFSLFFFSSYESDPELGAYHLLLESAKFADQNGFKAIWIPERHFHQFGGIFPNPSVVAAALAMTTRTVRIRAGSVVLPLHPATRVAEEWGVVDNLSRGRVDLAFAIGWNPNDFAVRPEAYARRKELTFEGIEQVKKLWRGEPLALQNGLGSESRVTVHPRPIQKDVELWLTCTGAVERFVDAGTRGMNVLTALLFSTVEDIESRIATYREARAASGHDPAAGCVTLMLHTYLGEDIEVVREKVRPPFTAYLESSVDLWRQNNKKLDEMAPREREILLSWAFERYFRTSTLFGTVDSCAEMIERLERLGIGEIACLIDFGVDTLSVLRSLEHLAKLRDRCAKLDRSRA